MPNDQENAPVAVKSASTETRTCPGCGGTFPAGGRGMGKSFCSDGCRTSFHSVHRSEGFPLAPLIKAHHATRHAKPGTREAAICTFARRQIAEIARTFLDQDEEVGRDVVAYVGTLMDSGTLWVDRRAPRQMRDRSE